MMITIDENDLKAIIEECINNDESEKRLIIDTSLINIQIFKNYFDDEFYNNLIESVKSKAIK